jgi:hypothetical protein
LTPTPRSEPLKAVDGTTVLDDRNAVRNQSERLPAIPGIRTRVSWLPNIRVCRVNLRARSADRHSGNQNRGRRQP